MKDIDNVLSDTFPQEHSVEMGDVETCNVTLTETQFPMDDIVPAETNAGECPPTNNPVSVVDAVEDGEKSEESPDESDIDSEEERGLEKEMALWKRIEKLRVKIEASHQERIAKRVRKIPRKSPRKRQMRQKRNFLSGCEEVLMGIPPSHLHPPPPTPKNMQRVFGYEEFHPFMSPAATYPMSHHRLMGMRGQHHYNGGNRFGTSTHIGIPRFPYIGPPHHPAYIPLNSAYTDAVRNSHMMPPPPFPPPPYPGFGPFHPPCYLTEKIQADRPMNKEVVQETQDQSGRPSEHIDFKKHQGPYDSWQSWYQHLGGQNTNDSIKSDRRGDSDQPTDPVLTQSS